MIPAVLLYHVSPGRRFSGDVADFRRGHLHPSRELNGESPNFDVHRIRDLGTNRVLELKVADGPVLTVRMTCCADFEAGDTVTLEVDPGQVHVYPTEGRTG